MPTTDAAKQRNNTPQPVPHFSRDLRYTVPETASLLRQSVPRTWVDIRENKLTVIREGGRVFIPGSEIVRRSTVQAA